MVGGAYYLLSLVLLKHSQVIECLPRRWRYSLHCAHHCSACQRFRCRAWQRARRRWTTHSWMTCMTTTYVGTSKDRNETQQKEVRPAAAHHLCTRWHACVLRAPHPTNAWHSDVKQYMFAIINQSIEREVRPRRERERKREREREAWGRFLTSPWLLRNSLVSILVLHIYKGIHQVYMGIHKISKGSHVIYKGTHAILSKSIRGSM